jgi:hypothetical protein
MPTKSLIAFRLKLPVSQSMLNYFEQVRHEKEWQHQRKCTVQRKTARKKEQAKKYKHKKENTAKEKIEEYQVVNTDEALTFKGIALYNMWYPI